jgi:hypothetical protein
MLELGLGSNNGLKLNLNSTITKIPSQFNNGT